MRNVLNFLRNVFFWATLIVILMVVNIKISRYNNILSQGRTVLVPIYFVSEDDFIGGNRLRIRYESIIPNINFNKSKGVIVANTDVNKVIMFSHFYEPAIPMERGDFLLKYEVKRPYGFFDSFGVAQVSFGSRIFYFGNSALPDTFMRSRYAILKVADDGSSVLYGMADMNTQELGVYSY